MCHKSPSAARHYVLLQAAGEGVFREGTSVVLGLRTLGAYAVGAQIPPGSDKQLSVPETAAQAVDWEGISAAWKSGHPRKAIGIGIGLAAGAAGGGPGKAGKAARAEAEAGAGLRGEARAAAGADREPKGPYINNNPRATANEKAVGALLQRELKEEVTGEPEQKGEPSPDYRFHHADGRIERADLYSPTTGDKASPTSSRIRF